ncbi:hypothetical protein AN1V17_15350 [Vallitalea sediminicola]
MVNIETTKINEIKKNQPNGDIYILAKKLAEFIGNLDEKKNHNNDE